jgi:hypothetical protein
VPPLPTICGNRDRLMRRVDNHWDTHWYVAIHCERSDRSAMRARKRSICIHSLVRAAAAGLSLFVSSGSKCVVARPMLDVRLDVCCDRHGRLVFYARCAWVAPLRRSVTRRLPAVSEDGAIGSADRARCESRVRTPAPRPR